MNGNPYELGVIGGEVMPQSYTRPSPDQALAHRIDRTADLYLYGLEAVVKYDHRSGEKIESSPWLSQVRSVFGHDLVDNIRDIINAYAQPHRW